LIGASSFLLGLRIGKFKGIFYPDYKAEREV
jgi:hypothetical protein